MSIADDMQCAEDHQTLPMVVQHMGFILEENLLCIYKQISSVSQVRLCGFQQSFYRGAPCAEEMCGNMQDDSWLFVFVLKGELAEQLRTDVALYPSYKDCGMVEKRIKDFIEKHRSALRPTDVRSYSFDDDVVANDVQVQNQT
ncbi:Trafficking protein particle complex subunit 9 [Camelus dromedarius]|uniref:Trafficking protein particle complex subunit 9 n=1 Tax=Camelus dromedarius TaxID=9838 RepID=A0A5N4C0C7_CAMDR|nr:Trafficking protein particle complex subunit 9 [Camelus dromedarius]